MGGGGGGGGVGGIVAVVATAISGFDAFSRTTVSMGNRTLRHGSKIKFSHPCLYRFVPYVLHPATACRFLFSVSERPSSITPSFTQKVQDRLSVSPALF